jgi:hypothetical protein
MADQKEAKKPSEGMVSIYNRGIRTFLIDQGKRKPRLKLEPSRSLPVPASEAEKLLKYTELIETGKMSARDARTNAQLRAEIEALKAEKEQLAAELKAGSDKGKGK